MIVQKEGCLERMGKVPLEVPKAKMPTRESCALKLARRPNPRAGNLGIRGFPWLPQAWSIEQGFQEEKP